MDEDVFLEETLLKYEEDEEALLSLRDEAHSSRLSKWRRPTLSSGYLSSSQSIGICAFSLSIIDLLNFSGLICCGYSVFQQLEIDYIIGESRKELLPNWSGPAAILRIFGVTREGDHFTTFSFYPCNFRNILTFLSRTSAYIRIQL